MVVVVSGCCGWWLLLLVVVVVGGCCCWWLLLLVVVVGCCCCFSCSCSCEVAVVVAKIRHLTKVCYSFRFCSFAILCLHKFLTSCFMTMIDYYLLGARVSFCVCKNSCHVVQKLPCCPFWLQLVK